MHEPRANERSTTPARTLVALIASSLALAGLLLTVFDLDVQTVGANELTARRGDARAFFAADFVFIALYAVLTPVALVRFGRVLAAGAAPRWIATGAALLAAAGLVDVAENVLLLTGTASPSPGAVDVAHALAVPKAALFVGGAVPALVAATLAARAARGRRSAARRSEGAEASS